MFKFITINLLLLVQGSMAFSVLPSSSTQSRARFLKSTPYFLDDSVEVETKSVPNVPIEDTLVSQATISQVQSKAEKPKSKTVVKKKSNHKEGVFSPLVYAAKIIAGEDTINKIRAKFISLHSNVIGSFVETYETPIGTQVAKSLFAAMDSNGDGSLDKYELSAAFKALGFTWLKDKQVNGIFERADTDKNGVIDYVEFVSELPKTLKTNLIKLAKKNGEEMGWLV